MRTATRHFTPTWVGIFLLVSVVPLATPAAVIAAPSLNLVISQVYGGGGNAGPPSATYTHDYIEIFNRSTTTVSLAGKSLQYASASGTGNFGANTAQQTDLPAINLAPGQYYLVQESGGSVGSPLPTADLTDATPINMSGTAGKVALVNSTSSLGCNGGSTPCSASQLAQIIDLVGYGSANFFEGGSAAPALTNATSAFRASNGCTDTDHNGADFAAATPGARNTATAAAPCPVTLSINDVSLAEGNSGTTTFSFTVTVSPFAPPGGVTFDIQTADNTATTANNDYQAKSLTSQTIAENQSTYTFDVLVNGDINGETPDETFFVNVSNVTGATVGDGQGVGTIVNDDTCGLTYTPIYTIQGSGPDAAVTGTVSTEGIVVGDFEGTGAASGFYVQDAAGDSNSATSDGIFVFSGSTNLVSVGDKVRVTGYARERFNQTTINGSNSNTAAVTNVVKCGTGSVTATDVTLPFADATYPERFEGMFVRFPETLVIAEYFNYDRFGEIVLAKPLAGEDRPFTGTAIDEPGASANARTLANSLSRITLDDVNSAQNPTVLRHPDGSPFTLSHYFRGGDEVANATGVLGFDFSLYRIFPTTGADYTATNPRPAAPAETGGRLTVAAQNTLNFFVTADYPTGNPLDNKCGPSNTLECRGWDSDQPNEFTRQRDKLLATLIGLDADVIGLNELENSAGTEPLDSIVAGLPGYAYINTGTIGTDAIKVGLIYRTSTVTPLGSYAILNAAVDPRFIDTKSRPVLAQTFIENATGEVFTVAVNHLKSKGSGCDDVGDPDGGDGQGNCNGTRTLAAEALVDWLATDPTGSGDTDFLIIGDLNSYAMEDPIDAIKEGADDTPGTADDYTNLVSQFLGTYAYSYVFDGQSGYLDHALSSMSLTGQVSGVAEWHVNADEADVFDYDTSFKPASQDALYEAAAYRSSDHDGVVVGLNPSSVATTARATGKGTFADGSFEFAIQYNPKKSTSTLFGKTTLTLTGGLNFVSTGYDWLNVHGTDALFRGSGTLNGAAGYRFYIAARDEGTPGVGNDLIRIQLIEIASGNVVYDSQPGALVTATPASTLTSGNISVIQ